MVTAEYLNMSTTLITVFDILRPVKESTRRRLGRHLASLRAFSIILF